MRTREERKILREGKTLGVFSIVKLIGQGGFGDIYEVSSIGTSKHYAMKVERIAVRRQALKRELSIVRLLVNAPFFPQFICYNETPKYRYLVMELCGPSFSTLRRFLPTHSFTTSTILRVGYEMLRAIESFHSFGIIHRDIKPSNFLIRPSRKHPVALIDYGLSRCYLDAASQDSVRERANPGFVGTSKYASVNAHAGKELGRRDDLFSWFYSMVELWHGRLPWHGIHDREQIFAIKRAIDVARLLRGMPPAMANVWRLIRRLQRNEQPDYGLIKASISQAISETRTNWDEPWDWDDFETSNLANLARRAG
jgi:serine/threonine protein kinase